jgi:UDP-3-O-[3-hydroxymyristoyl] N-acetylglucosamine deacetylase
MVKHGSGSLVYTPWGNDELHVEMSLTHTHIGRQKISLQIDAGSYENEIAAARTFVFTDEDDPRLRRIPDYGIGITERSTYSATPLRFADEPVRHKILDLLGDMYVLNSPIYGTIQGENTHHWLNLQFMRKLISAMDGNDA